MKDINSENKEIKYDEKIYQDQIKEETNLVDDHVEPKIDSKKPKTRVKKDRDSYEDYWWCRFKEYC